MAIYMNRIIDFDLSKSEGKFTVKAGVDPELDMSEDRFHYSISVVELLRIYRCLVNLSPLCRPDITIYRHIITPK